MAVVLGALATSCAPSASATDERLQELVRTVLADAARRSGLDLTNLRVDSAEAVTWSDGSLGCPQPGQSYTQALVPGYRVQIEGNGKSYDYHASVRGSWVLCPAGRAAEPTRLDRF